MKASPVFVSSKAAADVFSWERAIRTLQDVYQKPLEQHAVPRRTIAAGRQEKASLRTMTAVPPGFRYYGGKLMGLSFDADGGHLEYVVVLFDRETNSIAGFVDGNLVTGFRTAATSAAAVDRLVKPGPASLAVLGSGLEATMHTRAIAAIRPLSEIRVYSPTPEKCAAFAKKMQDELGVPTKPMNQPRSAVEGADIVLAAARAQGENPILFGDWLSDGMTVISIGSTLPEQREIDVSVIERADFIVCDTVSEVLEESGDMLAAVSAGQEVQHKCHSLSALMAGSLDAIKAQSTLRMYKSVGSGLQDVVVAGTILELAMETGLATPLPMEFETKRV